MSTAKKFNATLQQLYVPPDVRAEYIRIINRGSNDANKMTRKEQIKKWFEVNPNKWVSTREVRTNWGESGDRRIRELRAEGFKIISRRREVDGKKCFTFYWSHPVEEQQNLFGEEVKL